MFKTKALTLWQFYSAPICGGTCSSSETTALVITGTNGTSIINGKEIQSTIINKTGSLGTPF